VRSYYLLGNLRYFLDYQGHFEWDYAKIKGVFDFWVGGFASSVYPLDDHPVDTFDYKMLRILENNKNMLTEKEMSSLLSIVDVVNHLVEKGWWEQRCRRPKKYCE